MRSQGVKRFRRVIIVVPTLLNTSMLVPSAELGVFRKALHAWVRHVRRA